MHLTKTVSFSARPTNYWHPCKSASLFFAQRNILVVCVYMVMKRRLDEYCTQGGATRQLNNSQNFTSPTHRPKKKKHILSSIIYELIRMDLLSIICLKASLEPLNAQ